MPDEVIELVTFRLQPGIDAEHFQARAAPAYAFCDRQPGFRWRRQVSRDDGTMVDMIEWADLAAAKAASVAILGAPECAEFLSAIDMQSVVMEHLPVRARSVT